MFLSNVDVDFVNDSLSLTSHLTFAARSVKLIGSDMSETQVKQR